jgi:hypothetical protein
MIVQKYVLLGGLLAFGTSMSMDNQKKSELKHEFKKDKKSMSRYLKFVGLEGATSSAIHNFFSKPKGLYGGACFPYNVAVKLLIDGDCKQCFGELLNEYDVEDSFLMCRSEANGKTILHHICDLIDENTFINYFQYIYAILSLHPSLVKTVDNQGKLPQVSGNQLGDFERDLLSNFMINYDAKNIVPRSLVLYCLGSKKFKEIEWIFKEYNLKKSVFFNEYSDVKTQDTYAHFIVQRMTRDNFMVYDSVLCEILQHSSSIAQRKNKNGQMPFDCINKDLLDEQKLTDDQISVLKKRLDEAFYSKNIFSVLLKK